MSVNDLQTLPNDVIVIWPHGVRFIASVVVGLFQVLFGDNKFE